MKKRTTPTNQVPTDELLDDRRRQFGRHLHPYALRRTAVPTVLADQPEFVALEVERRDTLAAEARISRVHDELVSRNDLARSEHQEAQRRAMLDGTPPPPPLTLEQWPFPEHTRGTFDQIHIVIEATERGLLDEQADRWARVLDKRSAPLRDALEQARATVAALEVDLAAYDRGQAALEALEALAPVDVSGDPDRVIRATREERRAAVVRMGSGLEEAQLAEAFEYSKRKPPPARR